MQNTTLGKYRVWITFGIISLAATFLTAPMAISAFGLHRGSYGPTSAATVTVTNTNDSGAGSLRQAIADAAPGDTINFSGGISGGTITLTSNRLTIDKNLTIQGPGAQLLSINGNDALSVFFIQQGSTVTLDGVTIKNGRSIAGGGIWNQGVLTVSYCTISGNTANADPSIGGGGGGIYNANGILTIRNSIVSGNTSTDSDGGGIFSSAGFGGIATLTVTNSTISGNTAAYGGGGIFHRVFDGTATLNVTNSTISGNSTGIYAQGNTQMLINSIVAGNTGGDIDSGTIETASHNLIGNAASSGGIVNGVNGNIVGLSGLLGPLRNNGGPTLTRALLSGSPAINAGDNCVLTANGCGDGNPALLTDQRGMPRNATVDIGAFERQNNEIPSTVPFDFDGDGKSDIGIFRPNGTGGAEWWIDRSTDGVFATSFGASTDEITAADFTGDGKADVAFWRPSTGFWYVLRSEDLSYYAFPFGTIGDVPVPADYDGDGKADPAVFRPSTSTWYIQQTTGGTRIEQFGLSTDVPVAADYDGDGKADVAVFRPTGGSGQAEWWIDRSAAGVFATAFGTSTDQAVPGEYTGDGKTDIAFWRPSTGEWYVLRSENLSYYAFPFGQTGDFPSTADYDGDGKADAAIFRNGTWYVLTSTGGVTIKQFGTAGDKPIPAAYLVR